MSELDYELKLKIQVKNESFEPTNNILAINLKIYIFYL